MRKFLMEMTGGSHLTNRLQIRAAGALDSEDSWLALSLQLLRRMCSTSSTGVVCHQGSSSSVAPVSRI